MYEPTPEKKAAPRSRPAVILSVATFGEAEPDRLARSAMSGVAESNYDQREKQTPVRAFGISPRISSKASRRSAHVNMRYTRIDNLPFLCYNT